ncbi:MAG: hypothetical protein Fur005_15070 [Roseiflexaceae bacterium]
MRGYELRPLIACQNAIRRGRKSTFFVALQRNGACAKQGGAAPEEDPFSSEIREDCERNRSEWGTALAPSGGLGAQPPKKIPFSGQICEDC